MKSSQRPCCQRQNRGKGAELTEFEPNSRGIRAWDRPQAGQGNNRAGLAPMNKISYIISSIPTEPLPSASLIPVGFCFYRGIP